MTDNNLPLNINNQDIVQPVSEEIDLQLPLNINNQDIIHPISEEIDLQLPSNTNNQDIVQPVSEEIDLQLPSNTNNQDIVQPVSEEIDLQLPSNTNNQDIVQPVSEEIDLQLPSNTNNQDIVQPVSKEIDFQLPPNTNNQDIVQPVSKEIDFQHEQEKIYSFLLETIQKETPEKALLEFRNLFIESLRIVKTDDTDNHDNFSGVYTIFTHQQEAEFHHTIKRCCYILVNNWETLKQHKYIQDLLLIFENYKIENQVFISPFIHPYSVWLDNFINSQNYDDLKIFANRHQTENTKDWVSRYSHFLFLAQFYDKNNPKEQRNIARNVAQQMRHKFKFDLAMYLAHSHSSDSYIINKYKNPSILGDQILRLIQIIASKKGSLSYKNIANIFIEQTQQQTLADYKKSLQKYLFFSIVNISEVMQSVQQHLQDKLSVWKIEKDTVIINKGLVLRISNHLIDILTTENGKEPALLFQLLVSQNHSLILAIFLIKIILISPNSKIHLEICISKLINCHAKYPADQCQLLIHFFEIFNIMLTIYAGNTEYTLINMKDNAQIFPIQSNFDDYRVFSQSI